MLKDNTSITFSSSSASSTGAISDKLTIQKEASSFRTYLVQDVIDGLDCAFDFANALEYTATRDGIYSFSFFVLKGSLNVNPNYNVYIKLKVYINSVLTNTFVKNTPIDAGSLEDLRLVQSFYLSDKDVVNFSFEVQKDSVGTPNPSVELFFTGFQLNYGNVSNYQLPLQNKINTIQGSWKFEGSRTLTTDVVINSNVKTDLTAIIFGGGLITNENNSPFYYDSLNNLLRVNDTTTDYFSLNIGVFLSGNLTSGGADEAFEVSLHRPNDTIFRRILYSSPIATDTFVSQQLLPFISHVQSGGADNWQLPIGTITGGFRIKINRISGNTVLTLNSTGNQLIRIQR